MKTPSDIPLPTLFLSHGAPDILLTEEGAQGMRDFMQQLPAAAEVRGICMVSAHWIAAQVCVTGSGMLETLHDFSGFAPELDEIQHPARGADWLTQRCMQALRDADIDADLDQQRGLDHGAWVPLRIAELDTDIPVCQVSVPSGGPATCAGLGDALRPLRSEGILVIGSGGSTHNLSMVAPGRPTEAWAEEFEQWLATTVEAGHFGDLLHAETLPRSYWTAHRNWDHFAPLIVAWAAAGRGRDNLRFHQGFTYGNLGMSCFRFT